MDTMDGFHEHASHNISTTFFKCIRWQIEETTDLIHCPFHYYCDSSYSGDYPPLVDLFVLLFVVASFLSVATFTAFKFQKSRNTAMVKLKRRRRYLLPSGPIGLPVVLAIFAKGYKINSVLPLMHIGPAILQLVHVSALAFRNQVDNNVHYVMLEASTISGILHASLYLDSIILPFYTGLEALKRSTFSGECPTCVCRREALVVGGGQVLYRGWSKTTWSLVASLFSRMLCRIYREEKMVLLIKEMAQVLSWLSVACDAIYFTAIVPQKGVVDMVAYGGICILIFFNLLKKVGRLLDWLKAIMHGTKKMIDFVRMIGFGHKGVEIV